MPFDQFAQPPACRLNLFSIFETQKHTYSNSMKTNQVALIVHSCDRYQLLYQAFGYFFNKYWNSDVAVSCYFATEELSVSLENFSNIQSGKGEWSDRLSRLLDLVEEEYVIYLQEDMWLSKPVSGKAMAELIELSISNQWKQVKLNSSEVFKTQQSDLFLEGLNLSLLDNQASGFLMSHQATLWNKAFLKQQLLPGEHPWRNERKGTKRLKKLNPEIYHIDLFCENGHLPNHKNQDEQISSAYSTVSQNATLNDRALPFIQMLKADPQQAQYGQQLQHHYDQQITHDGKPKPLKKDIFKKIKDWIKGK